MRGGHYAPISSSLKTMKHSVLIKCFLVLLTTGLWVSSMPPYNVAESAYVLFVPLLLWVSTSPNWKSVTVVGLCSAFFSWLLLFVWLRHVTYIGTIILSFYLAFYALAWIYFVRFMWPRLLKKGYVARTFGSLSVAGAWVFLEWLRSYMIYGTPMAPLALSQWQRPVILQVSAWTGAYGVSFFLIFFNCCIALAFFRLIQNRRKMTVSRWFNTDFYTGVGALLFLFFIFIQCIPNNLNNEKESFDVAFIQPNFEPLKEWDPLANSERLAVLETEFRRVGLLDFDTLLLPEAVTANPVLGDYDTLHFFESWAQELQSPILSGNTAHIEDSLVWYNGVFKISPTNGLDSAFYAKRRLVPFGEYVPFPFDGLLKSFGAAQGSFKKGDSLSLIPMTLNGHTFAFGSLVCYEDMFPDLARASVLGGADILFVATNDAWYGEEGAAQFHAAHSTLRAVENRRPVLRSGNAGWSGWIDAFGKVRFTLMDSTQSIYFRGSGATTIHINKSWSHRKSFYTERGDWFVGVCLFMALTGYLIIPKTKHQATVSESSLCSSINS